MPNIEPKKLPGFIHPPAPGTCYLKVAVGVIRNDKGELLISQRRADLPSGGLWEFAGGKFEGNETARQALRRELNEELGIDVITARPLICLKHHYPDVAVKLFVFVVEKFSGEVASTLGQVCHWVSPAKLDDFPFLAANKAIIRAAQLPHFMPLLTMMMKMA